MITKPNELTDLEKVRVLKAQGKNSLEVAEELSLPLKIVNKLYATSPIQFGDNSIAKLVEQEENDKAEQIRKEATMGQRRKKRNKALDRRRAKKISDERKRHREAQLRFMGISR